MGEREKWTPRNYESTGGLTTLREGLVRFKLDFSKNGSRVSSSKTGKRYCSEDANNPPIRAVDSIALGTSEVKPIEIVVICNIRKQRIYSTQLL